MHLSWSRWWLSTCLPTIRCWYAVALALRTEPGAETLEFVRGARAEVRKVVWPTRAETTQTTLVVIAMVVIMGLLLWMLDLLLLWLVRLITG